MKKCPHCQAETVPDYQICWNCNYSFSAHKIVEHPADSEEKTLDCLRCRKPIHFAGTFKFHEGKRFGALGNLFELFVNKEAYDVYVCPQCKKVEFFVPDSY